MDGTDRVAEGFITSGGRVETGGCDGGVGGLLDGADPADFAGRVAVAGFLDAHRHLEVTKVHWSYATQRFVLAHAWVRDIYEGIRAAAAEPADDWIIGRSNLSLRLRDAIRMFTADAYACHMDNRGVIALGKLADFFLGEDDEQVPIDQLSLIPADVPVIDGASA